MPHLQMVSLGWVRCWQLAALIFGAGASAPKCARGCAKSQTRAGLARRYPVPEEDTMNHIRRILAVVATSGARWP